MIWGEVLVSIPPNQGYQIVPTGYYDLLTLTGGAPALAGDCQAGVIFGLSYPAGLIPQAQADVLRATNLWHLIIGPVTPDVGYQTLQVRLPLTNRPAIIVPFTTIENFSLGAMWTRRD